MGTRADFYTGKGKTAKWLGSIAYDGYPASESHNVGVPFALFSITDEKEWEANIAVMLADDENGTLPEQGWPWPWTDSGGTDYAYTFDAGKVWISPYGNSWYVAIEYINLDPEEDEELSGEPVEFPDMSSVRRVTLGRRSGLMVVGMGGPVEDD